MPVQNGLIVCPPVLQLAAFLGRSAGLVHYEMTIARFDFGGWNSEFIYLGRPSK